MYMDSKNGGLSPEERQRQTAAEIARRKVLLAYEKKEVEVAADFIKKQEKEEQKSEGVAGKMSENRSALKNTDLQRSRGVLGVSSTPVIRQVSNEEWKKYHTALQDYYQNYYSEYYMNAAKEYVAKEQVKNIRAQAEGSAKPSDVHDGGIKGAVMSGAAEKEASEERSFKARIRARAEEKKRWSRRRWLTPIFAGVAVMLTILFLQYNRLIFAPIMAYVSPGEQLPEEISPLDPTVTLTKVSAENKLIIPKLNVDVPIEFGVGLDGVMKAMNQGVVHYRISGASAFPGEIGNFVITGHSAGDIYSNNQYKFIFSGLERLEAGDIIYVHYNETRYTYKMVKNEVIEPSEVSKLVYETDKPILTLVTCWPLGTSRYRLLVTAEQISPSYETAEKGDEPAVAEPEEGVEMPRNEETLFERIKRWFEEKILP